MLRPPEPILDLRPGEKSLVVVGHAVAVRDDRSVDARSAIGGDHDE
jgi:hypothetical protein